MNMEKRERRETQREAEREIPMVVELNQLQFMKKKENVPSFCQTAETFFLHLRKERKPSNEETDQHCPVLLLQAQC